MIHEIRNISVNDLFWCSLQNHLFTFGFKGLPDKVHLTIVFGETVSDINFHVTKNTGDYKNKPQIKIVIINQDELINNAKEISSVLLKGWLKPFDLKEFKKKHNDEISFLSYDRLNNSGLSEATEKQFKESFKGISRIKGKTRLKVKGDINDIIEKFTDSENLLDLYFNELEEVADVYYKPMDGGFIISNQDIIQVIRIDKEWFSIKKNSTPFDILCLFVDRKTAYIIICHTLEAIDRVSRAESYTDTEKYNNPIRLTFQTIT